MRLQCLDAPSVLDGPHSEGFVVADGEQVLAAGMQSDAAHPIVVADQREETRAGEHVPKSD